MRQDWFQAKVQAHAEKNLVIKPGAKRAEIVALFKKFLKVETHRQLIEHRAGAGGREVAQGRSLMMDILLRHVFLAASADCAEMPTPLCVVAIGG